MKRLVNWALLAVLMLSPLGCVAQSEVDRLRTLYRRCQEQVVDLQALLEEANARIKAMEEAANTRDPDTMAKLQQAIAERDRLQTALSEAEERLRRAGMAGMPALPAPLDSALRQLAQQHPDLMTYDAAKGMVRFRSDLTFALGSTQVNPEAVATLNRLADILKSPIASGYETRIVGHTDNVRIARPETKAQHPTNWHLSVHRAIAVKDVLEKAGVAPASMGVAGYGEYQPIVPNGRRGAEGNRRVEIYLLPAMGGAAAEPAAADVPMSAPGAVEAPAGPGDAAFK